MHLCPIYAVILSFLISTAETFCNVRYMYITQSFRCIKYIDMTALRSYILKHHCAPANYQRDRKC